MLLIFTLIVLGIIYYLGKTKNLGIIKLPLAYIYILIQKKRLKPTFVFDADSIDPEKTGIVAQTEGWVREAPRELSSNIHSGDLLRICGLNKNGNFLFVSLVRRHGRRAEIHVHLRLASGEEYEHPAHPDTHIYNTSGTSFSAGGLTFDLLEPLKRWRVIFKGYLRKRGTTAEANDDVMVQFNFIWHPINNYVEFPYDFNAKYLTRKLAEKDWLKDFSTPCLMHSEEWHTQFGQIHGLITIEEKGEIEMFLRGLKIRKNGVINWKKVSQKLSIEGLLHNGTNFHLFIDENKNNENYLYGYICPPCNMTVKHITKFDFDTTALYNALKDLSKGEFTFEAGKEKFKLKFMSEDFEFKTFVGEEWSKRVSVKHVALTLNGKEGKGVVEHTHPSETICPNPERKSLPQLLEPVIRDCPKSILTLNDRECQSSAVVGGKGASLALMSTLSDSANKLIVPKGVCITKTAFSRHLQENQNLEALIDRLHKVAWGHIPGSIADECENLTKAVHESKLLGSVKKELKIKLLEEFGDIDSIRFAVRSSAIGEDGEEMSAAGQNETFLGVKGFEQIYDALLKCWASQFAFRSVEYKRQNGQLFNAGMGVVIQEMVPADVAGVLFTRDPISGSPAKMYITANYGLGESVVSATADPDTIILKRTWDDKLSILSEQIGKKNVMISMSEDGGTIETEILPDQANKCTVTSELAIELGNIAIYLEQLFGTARDIEWAVKGKQIFLLQSRPVTTENEMLDFEIHHEFDSVLRTDEEMFSTANVGEVMPGAMSPLTVCSVFRAQIPFMQKDLSWKIESHRFDPTVDETFGVFYSHAMFDRIQQKSWSLEKKKGTVGKAWEISIYGRILDDDDIVERALERYSAAPLTKRLALTIYSFKGALFWKRYLRESEKRVWRRPLISHRCETAWETYSELGFSFLENRAAMMAHFQVSMSSTLWNQIILNMLSSGLEDFSTEQYSDFANIVGSGNGTESGDVPFSLRKLTTVISTEIEPEAFCKMSLSDAHEWLQQNNGKSTRKFKKFINRHGHRGIKEFDLGCESWSRNPESVVEVLQGMVGNLDAYKKPASSNADDILGSIKTKLSPFKRRLFPWLMKKCRQAVCGREKAKSLLIKAYDNTRREYQNLADMMVKEGFIPDPKLIVFFTHEEIGMLIKTRSPAILRRVKHRCRVFPYMDRIKFPEMINGLPKPFDEDDTLTFEGATQVTGYPVSQGVTKGLARVITSFHEVNTIKPGEILITFCTDIGWSPYFPMLSGVVTEIGGLISHGAVVAREFGLPCIVGAQNATKVFKTGETVLLNATKGIISKID